MNKLPIILTLFLTMNCFGQDTFIVRETVEQDSLNENDFKVNKYNIFEDSLYIVSKSCSGEWGGTIKFKNKKTGIEYSASSTCPVVVNKLNGKYYVTNTLAHLMGSSEILEIGNPDSMAVVEKPKPKKKYRKPVLKSIGDYESKSTIGTKQLVDTIGVMALASFTYNGQLYHIITNFNMTFLTKIENNRFIIIDTVSNKRIRTYEPEVIMKDNGHMIVLIKKDTIEGVLDIYENQITVRRRK